MSLTATATKDTKTAIVQLLGMNNCEYVMKDANKTNIRYSVLKVDCDYRKNFKWLIKDLVTNGKNTSRHIIFCRRAEDMHKLFRHFELVLGHTQFLGEEENLPENIQLPYQQRLFAMYHQKTDPEIQAHIRTSFGDDNGIVRVLFCTIAFGMGVNVKGVSNVIHYGPSGDLDDFVQESGRGGRNSQVQSHSVLINYKGSTRGSNISKQMRDFVKDNKICKRKTLLHQLHDNVESNKIPHTCCSVCTLHCRCLCKCNLTLCQCVEICVPRDEYMSLCELKLSLANNESTSSESDSEHEFENIYQFQQTTRNRLVYFRYL